MATLPEGFGVELGGLAAFQTQAIEAGLSARAALTSFREAGGAIADARWYGSYGEIQAAIGNGEVLSGVLADQVPDAGMFSQWSGVPEGKFGYAINLQLEDTYVDEAGKLRYAYQTEPSMVISETPLSPQEAFTVAAERWPEEAESGGNTPRGQIVGFTTRNLFRRRI